LVRPASGVDPVVTSGAVPRAAWKKIEPLFRGDNSVGPVVPDPPSKTGIVEHILYLGGHGRKTPFSSTSESEEVAEHFAGPQGQVWKTSSSAATAEGAKHLPRKQLLENLKGFGRGKAKWNDAFEVAQAARYVDEWSEHLLDWSGTPTSTIGDAVTRAFRKRS
jgi:hypothetical protein